ncbi:MAG: hypothetical protein AAGA80_04705 [Cyanobacteria bacterium P01_F01_bin.143]
MSTSTNLIAFANTKKEDNIDDIIFIHGLGGDALNTWRHPDNQDDENNFWLAWLADDFPKMGIWSLAYEVEPKAWKGSAMPLVERADNSLDLLEIKDIGKRPIFFITHSMGGLLIKQMLRNANDSGNDTWLPILENTKGIVYLATPHTGSSIASFIKFLGAFTSVSVKELEAHHPRLRELNRVHRNKEIYNQIPIKVYGENKPLKLKGIKVIDLIVDKTSVDPGRAGVTPIILDRDHISIAKPESPDDRLYVGVKRFIQANIQNGDQPSDNGVNEPSGNSEQVQIGSGTDKVSPKIDLTQPIQPFATTIKRSLDGFVGRRHVFHAWESFCNYARCGYFTVVAYPGEGKTAIAARLTKLCEDQGQLYIYYFNVRGDYDKAPQFLQNICQQIHLLAQERNFTLPKPPLDAYSNGTYFKNLLTHLSQHLQAIQRSLTIIIDALDEVDRTSQSSHQNCLYLPVEVPSHIYFFLTQRPAKKTASLEPLDRRLSPFEKYDLREYRERCNTDVRLYIEQALVDQRFSIGLSDYRQTKNQTKEDFITDLLQKSDGNFMYLTLVLRDIAVGGFRQEELPDGLVNYYQTHWQRMEVTQEQGVIVAIICYYTSPPTLEDIVDTANKIDINDSKTHGRVGWVLSNWEPFLEVVRTYYGDGYRFYHKSYQDFLAELDPIKAFGKDIKAIKQLILDTNLDDCPI